MQVDRLIFIIAIFVLLFCLLEPIILKALGIEFADNNLEFNLVIVRAIAFPISVFIALLLGTIKSTHTQSERGWNFFAIFLISSFSCLVSLFLIFFSMCNWSNNKILYTHKTNDKIKIFERAYGCGAYDSNRTKYQIFYVRQLSKHFIYTSEIDINKIDSSEWNKPDLGF